MSLFPERAFLRKIIAELLMKTYFIDPNYAIFGQVFGYLNICIYGSSRN